MNPVLSVFMIIVSAATVLVAAALFFGAIMFSIINVLRWQGVWRVLAALPIAALIAWGIVIIVSISLNRTSHNLWPLELILWAAGAWLITGILILARRILQRG